jgi:hypothetical protein
MTTEPVDWFKTAISITPIDLGWSLHRGVLANRQIGWVLRERNQAFHVLDVPEIPGPSALTNAISHFAGQYAADTLVGQAMAKVPYLLADSWKSA